MIWSKPFFGVSSLKHVKKYWHVSIEISQKYSIGTITNFAEGDGHPNKKFEYLEIGKGAEEKVMKLLREKVVELDILDA